MARDGWSALFSTAFKQSKNSMALVDEQRRHVDVNNAYLRLLGHARDDVIGRPVAEFLVGGPLMTPAQWAAALAAGHFMGEAQMIRADGSTVDVQWAGHTEVVTGQRLVLFVALSTSRWGASFRRTADADGDPRDLSARELEIVRLIARGESGPEIARRAPHRPRHRAHARPQRDEEGRRALARPSRRQGPGQRRRPRLSEITQLRYRRRMRRRRSCPRAGGWGTTVGRARAAWDAGARPPPQPRGKTRRSETARGHLRAVSAFAASVGRGVPRG